MSKRRRRRLSGLPRRRREPFGDLRQQAARCLPSPAVEEIDRGDLGCFLLQPRELRFQLHAALIAELGRDLVDEEQPPRHDRFIEQPYLLST